MKTLSEYQKNYKAASQLLFTLLQGTDYSKVARPINGYSIAITRASSMDIILNNYIELIEKLSYLKGVLQNDSKIMHHLTTTTNMLKVLYHVATKELTADVEETFIIVKAEKEGKGVRLRTFRTYECPKIRGAVVLRLKGEYGQVEHLQDGDWSLNDIMMY